MLITISFLNVFMLLKSFDLLDSSLFLPKRFSHKLFQKSMGWEIVYPIILAIQVYQITHFVELFSHILYSPDIKIC